ncbi:diguanylate cyclase/phosphodiesterase (GGDEF & EAL domains) with PAS/PAC sensor(s) [Nitrincola lacisaponensis]|uniref:Diguanylate cyclase/phosphodiesterase (GGDEF & EAL domains) with PAS/PAC sensor(S) n=1 Tax=Nitrincola lacisaponensis TaxID=267850 RepID=A0A063Y3E1_9GAMM|nr:HD domain-containing phosphohydrolase [Nitrincola lacisaponensis]KDE39002.1 diguanylate cyclase/phosphodiesterase (GGDEF & EAL domains) with PAS/PAC sensor(s) [Nitrincola lacisaponensis]
MLKRFCVHAGHQLSRFYLLAILLCSLISASFALPAQADTVRIGVLSLRGDDKAMATWQGMLDHLNQQLPEHEFQLVPLGFDQINLAIRQRNVDFIIANSSIFVYLEKLYGANAIATLYTRTPDGIAVNHFGGVIFSRVDNSQLRQLNDLKGKRVAAVDETSFGGWQTGLRELQRQGIAPGSFRSLTFLHTHDAVALAVLRGEADAGFVRTGTLEQMELEGSLQQSDFFVLSERHLSGFPYRLSTTLYPEWPMAKLPHISDSLALSVAMTLFTQPEHLLNQHSPDGAGWGLPQNYQPVHELLRELKLEPYAYLNNLTLADTLRHYALYVLLVLLASITGLAVLAYVIHINRRLQIQQHALGELNNVLEARVSERTSQIEGLLDREQYLRSIVQTVADVNQIIITSTHRLEMLKSACDRLVSHPEYRFAWVAMLRTTEQGKCIERLVSSYGSTEQLVALTQAPEVLAQIQHAIESNSLTRLSPEQFSDQNLSSLALTSAVLLPLRSDAFSSADSMLCVYTHRPEGFDEDEIDMLDQLAGDLGFAMHAFMHREESEQAEASRIRNYEETIQAMVDMIEKRDTYTAGHTRRVAQYAELIARKMQLPEEQVQQLVKASTLHDIGKIIIPDAVLLKPGSLTPLEYELIKQHVTVGYETLSAIKMYRDLAELMRHHHERLDGSGYPQGLRNGDIPLPARIMAVADSFDAMTSNRIYKPRKSVDNALQELQQLAGSHYDPEVVDAAVTVLKDLDLENLYQAEQLPDSDLERQRFAYFFNDQLTGLYNAEYLRFMLQRDMHVHFQSLQILLLQGFAEFNHRHGWHAGNQLLKDFAQWLEKRCSGAMLFRVMGDDFVVINAPDGWLDGCNLLTDSPLQGTAVGVQQQRFSCDPAGLAALQDFLK